MPDLAVHYYFGQNVRESLPSEAEIIPDVFDFALSGPDDWFYCFSNRRLYSRGPYMHRNKTGEFLSALASEPSLFSYFAGFFCHYILDAVCHPYIISCTGRYDGTASTRKYLGSHTAFERALDRWILKDHPGKHPLTDVMFRRLLPSQMKEPVNRVYKSVFGWDNTFQELLTAKEKMRKYLHILEDPHGTAGLITSIVRHPFLLPLPYSRHYYEDTDFLNLSHRQWHHPGDPEMTSRSSFPELMKQAELEAVRAIAAARAGDLSLIGNRSYITGFDLEDERNNRPETFSLLER